MENPYITPGFFFGMSHVTCERAEYHFWIGRVIQMSRVTYGCVVSHMNESCHY